VVVVTVWSLLEEVGTPLLERRFCALKVLPVDDSEIPACERCLKS
jgi:hypothetical protein